MRITRKWALTLFLIVSMLVTTPGIGVALAAGEATAARVDVTIAAGETAEVVIVMKTANLAGVSTADAIGTLKAQAAATQAAAIETVTANGGIVENTFWINNSIVARVDAATLARLALAPNVDYIIPNFTVTAIENEQVAAATAAAAATPAANTWGLDFIGAPAAWAEYGVNGTGVKIAVLDTGINTGTGTAPGTFTGHPDLAGKLFSVYPNAPWFPGGWMTWKPDGTIGPADGLPLPVPMDIIKKPYDSAQHGTHVSGTIVGGAASGTRIGVAPGAQLMMGLVLPEGSGSFAQVLAGMQWAIAPYDKMGGPAGTPADIVSMSLGSTGYYAAFIPAIEAIRAVGCEPVIAIGNEGPGTSGSPGNVWHAMGIGAVDNTGTVGSFSGGEVVYKSDFAGAPGGWGAPDSWITPDFSAPGVGIMSSVPVGTGPGGTNYDTWNGTSMATPHVAGALALMIQYRRLHPAAMGGVELGLMFGALRDSAFDPPWSTPGKDTRYGHGIINVRNAISVLRGGTIAPKIEVIPGWPDPIKVAEDGGADFTLKINNKGSAPLSFNLTEQPIGGGPARAGSKTVLSESAAPAAPGNAKASAGAKASSYKYTVSGAAGPSILVYTDDAFLSAGNTYVEQALIALGLSYTGFYSDPSGFNAALTGGGPWDLVLVSQNNYFSAADLAALNSYVIAGGKLIIETFYMDASPTAPLWDTMGVDWVSNMGSPENLYRWLIGDPVFNSPENIPDMVPTETSYSDDGDKIDPVGGVEPLAGFTPSAGPNQSGIIRSPNGYVNSFIISDFRGDDDADGKVDAVELWINEIANISGAAADVPWLSEDPASGFVAPGGTLDVMVSVNAGGLGLGFFGAVLVVNSDDPTAPSLPFPVFMEVSGAPVIDVSPMDPLTFVINKGEQAVRENAFTIFNYGGGDLFVDISDQFAKGTSTSAGVSGGSNLPAPEAGPARSLPGNTTVSASAVKPSTGPGPGPGPADGRMFSGDKLNIGVSNFGELDWRNPAPARPDGSWMGYGFEYKPQAAEIGGAAESTAIGWNGEGYVVYYDGRAIAEYPDYRSAGIVPMGADILMDTPDTLRYRVSTQTDDAKLQVNFIITFNKHSRAVQMTTEFINIGPSFIGEIKYKRVVDWDAGASAGNDINWHYNSDLSILSTVDPPSGAGKFYAYGFGAMGDSWPMVYDYDLNAWDDYNSIDHGSTWEQADIAGPFDGNVAMYFAVGPLGPGERKQVNTVYTVGEGTTADAAYADMLTNLGGGKSGDVPWLNQNPSKPVIPGSGASGVNVSVDGRGLAPGRYFANILINHNDPGCPPLMIPVQVVVNAGFKSVVSDPEDVNPIPPAPPAPKLDINELFVQLSKTSILFNTTLYNVVPDDTLVLMTMMDTGKGVGYTGPGSNDIQANYMLFGFVYPAGPGPAASKAIASADLSAYAKFGLSASSIASIKSGMVKAAAGTGPGGQLYLFKWDDPSKTWAPLMETYAIGLNSEAGTPGTFSIWQLTYLPLMYSDGSMKVVQSAGSMWELVDTAPDRGHGATVPARDIEVTGVDAVAAADAAPSFLTGQTVEITASVANNGDEAERDLPVDFQVIPVLGERATEPGEPGYPAPALTLGDPIELGSSLIEVINPGDTGTASVSWTPELLAAAASRSKVKAAIDPDPWIHSYLLRASVAALPRETSSADNSAQTLVDVQVGVEVGLSDIWVDDFGPTGIDAKGPVDIVYTGMSYFLKVTVTNNGGMDITDYEVAFIVDGNYIGSQLVSLAAGESADLWQEWTPDAAGLYIEVRAEGAVLTGEINPDDNAAVTSIDVEAGTDVAVNTLTFSPVTPAYGNTVTFTATVSNNGNLDLAGVTVLFDVNGAGIGMQSVDLAIGESATVEQTWAADQVGSLTARASVSPLPYETYTANNTKTTPISVSGKDIGITAFTITPPVGQPLGKKGKLHSVKVTVKNNGTSSQTFQLRLTQMKDGVTTQVGTTRPTVTALAKGASKVVTMTSWTPAWMLGASPPTFLLRVEVGTSSGTTWNFGLLDDIEPGNDAMEQSIAGVASLRAATVTGVAVTGTPLAGKASVVKVTAANTGNEAVKFSVELYANDKLVRTTAIGNLAVAASRSVNVSWTPPAPGSYTLSAKVRAGDTDSDGEVVATAATVYVPVSLKLTSAVSSGLNKTVKIHVQLMNPTGTKEVALGGVAINVKAPAGVMLSSAATETGADGGVDVFVTMGASKTATVTITAPGLATRTIVIKLP